MRDNQYIIFHLERDIICSIHSFKSIGNEPLAWFVNLLWKLIVETNALKKVGYIKISARVLGIIKSMFL